MDLNRQIKGLKNQEIIMIGLIYLTKIDSKSKALDSTQIDEQSYAGRHAI